MSERIQLSRVRGWRKPEGAVVVARPSRWGNPARVLGGSVAGPTWADIRDNFGQPRHRLEAQEVLYVSTNSRELATIHAVELFRTLCVVFERDYPDRFKAWMEPLRGRDLACWCPLDAPCHADVLLELANPASQDALDA